MCVQEVLGERVKAFLAWQNAVTTLHKKREQRSRMELGGRLDKVRGWSPAPAPPSPAACCRWAAPSRT